MRRSSVSMAVFRELWCYLGFADFSRMLGWIADLAQWSREPSRSSRMRIRRRNTTNLGAILIIDSPVPRTRGLRRSATLRAPRAVQGPGNRSSRRRYHQKKCSGNSLAAASEVAEEGLVAPLVGTISQSRSLTRLRFQKDAKDLERGRLRFQKDTKHLERGGSGQDLILCVYVLGDFGLR